MNQYRVKIACFMATTRKHALVFGASGVSGWAVVNQLLQDYPSPGTWSKVTALTNRPLTFETSQWPTTNKLEIISGLNLLEKAQETFEEQVKSRITDITTVTHVFYYGKLADLRINHFNVVRVD